MSKGMFQTTIREIRGSLGRYMAILAIVMLGVGLFTGLKGDHARNDHYGKRVSGGTGFF